MPVLTLYERVIVRLIDILDQEKFSDKIVGTNRNLEDVTFEDLGIGGEPIGLGELLELRDCLEKEFNVQFSQDELPDYFEAPKVTLKQIAEVITRKIEAKVSASNTAA